MLRTLRPSMRPQRPRGARVTSTFTSPVAAEVFTAQKNVAPRPLFDFSNSKSLYAHKSATDLAFNYAILEMCSWTWFVQQAPRVLDMATKLGLFKPAMAITKSTFFRQFCSGETIEASRPALTKLGRMGVGAILDYAVEHGNGGSAAESVTETVIRTIKLAANEKAIAFSCVKISGICTHALLHKMSALLEHQKMNPAFSLPWSPFPPEDVPTSAPASLVPPPALTAEEESELTAALERFDRICAPASEHNLPLLVDAEQTWYQPAIDWLVHAMSRKYNRERPIIYNTYQLYLRSGLKHLESDLAQARREGYFLGAKLVRDMAEEAMVAQAQNVTSPVHPTIEATHQAYDAAVESVLRSIAHAALMVASHNTQSLVHSTRALDSLLLPRAHPRVHFGQLYGMCDHMSISLAQAGYQTCKYVPFGPVEYVIPYLTRRLQENSALIGRASEERTLIAQELSRRVAELFRPPRLHVDSTGVPI